MALCMRTRLQELSTCTASCLETRLPIRSALRAVCASRVLGKKDFGTSMPVPILVADDVSGKITSENDAILQWRGWLKWLSALGCSRPFFSWESIQSHGWGTLMTSKKRTKNADDWQWEILKGP